MRNSGKTLCRKKTCVDWQWKKISGQIQNCSFKPKKGLLTAAIPCVEALSAIFNSTRTAINYHLIFLPDKTNYSNGHFMLHGKLYGKVATWTTRKAWKNAAWFWGIYPFQPHLRINCSRKFTHKQQKRQCNNCWGIKVLRFTHTKKSFLKTKFWLIRPPKWSAKHLV